MISPLIGPTLGYYSDLLRKVFGLKTASEKASESKSLEDSIKNE